MNVHIETNPKYILEILVKKVAAFCNVYQTACPQDGIVAQKQFQYSECGMVIVCTCNNPPEQISKRWRQ